jgi:hypothetical protein
MGNDNDNTTPLTRYFMSIAAPCTSMQDVEPILKLVWHGKPIITANDTTSRTAN